MLRLVLVGGGGAVVGATVVFLIGGVPSTEERIARRYVDARAAYARCRESVAAERRSKPGLVTVEALDALDALDGPTKGPAGLAADPKRREAAEQVALARDTAGRCAEEEREQQAATLSAELRMRRGR
ncbi:MAG: hypothetical protein FJ027_05105 [Candidatus Rokubacteria bacterium]|nr:hypothetical protein [Candidatus Rokubacteria bacterium]